MKKAITSFKLLFSFILLSLLLNPTEGYGQCLIGTAPLTDCWLDDISDVTIGSISNTSGGCDDYYDGHTYFLTPSWTVVKGQTYPFSVSHGLFAQECAIWIDYNNDGQFGTTEMVFSSNGTTLTHTGNITIPTTAATATVRVRVRSVDAIPFQSNEACINVQYGETEDYNMTIQAPPPLDVGASRLNSPSQFNCGGTFPVVVTIQNYGSNLLDFSVNNVTVTGSVSGTNPTTFTPVVISTGTLAPAATLNVTLSASYNMTALGTYTFNASATTTGDGNTTNDAMSTLPINVSYINTFPNTVNFSAIPSPPYQVQQVSGSGNWAIQSGGMTNPTLSPVIGTGMAFFESYNFPNAVSRLVTPCYDFTGMCNPVLEFWMSQDNGFSTLRDSIAVKVSTNGGQSYSSSLLRADRYNALFTVPGWRLFTIPLTAYGNLNGVRVAFEAYSDYGNNMAIDAVIVRNDTMARISGTSTICTGSSANLSVNLTGTSPFSLTYTNGVTPVTVTGITANPYIISVTPTATRTYTITGVSNACGSGLFTGSGIITIQPTPTSSLSGSQTVCAGAPANISVTLTGTGPWNITWTNGTANNNVNGINTNPYVITVNPVVTATYTITALSDAVCTGTTFTGSHVIAITPVPTANLTGSNTICPSTATNIAVALTGQSPWSVTYTDGTTPVTVTGITSALRLFSVTPAATTTYTITNVSNVCGAGSVSGSAVIVVSNIATATLSGGQTICSGGNAQLSVNFGGASPFSFTYTNGTTPVTVPAITANPYTFTVTPSASTTYSLTSMSNSCGAGLVSGTAAVMVNNNPAASLSAPGTVCAGNGVVLTVNLTGSNPWNLTYTDGTTPQSETGITTSPHIFSVTPLAGNTYTITGLTNAFSCNGTNLGTPVSIIVNDLPTVSLASNQTICGSSAAVLTVNLSSGTTPYDFDWTDGTSTFTETGITSSAYTLTVNPAVTTTYTINNVTNICGNLNPASTAVITILPSITATLTGPTNVCAGNAAQLTLTVTGTSPYTLDWLDGFTGGTETGIATSPYSFNVTPLVNNLYDIDTIWDANNCYIAGGSAFSITVDSLPTANLSGDITACAGAPGNLDIFFTGTGPYDLVYFDGATNIPINGILTSPYSITSGVVAGTTTYTLVSVSNTQCGAGTATGSGTITVLTEPVAVLAGNSNLCGTNSTTLTVNFTGNAPWNMTYTDGGSNYFDGGIMTSPYVFSVTPSINPGIYSILTLGDAQCNNGTSTGTATVNVGSPPNATMSGNSAVCNGGNYALTFNLTGTAPFSVTFTDGTTPVTVPGIPSTPYVHVVNPISPTTYSLTYATDQFCGNGQVSSIVPVVIQPLPTASFTPVLLYGGQISTFNNSLYGANYSWDFGDATGTVTGFQPLHTYASNGVFTITLTVTNGCGSASATQTIIVSSVGTEKDIELAGIRVYPNPNEGKFTLELPENLENALLELRDLKGALIWKSNANSRSLTQEIDLRQQLSKGSYLLRVIQGDKSWTKKLSIE
jgi:hypothetical protein